MQGKPVFDVKFYQKSNADLRKAYQDDMEKYYLHFIRYGSAEGRQGCEEFEVYSYRARYADLRKAYQDDLDKYYEHYQNYGKQEGRDATANNQIYTVVFQRDDTVLSEQKVKYGHSAEAPELSVNGAEAQWDRSFDLITSDLVVSAQVEYMVDGINYDAVFDADEYLQRYGDLRAAYGTDGSKALNHFVTYGMAEGRQGKSSFDVKAYADNYADLRKAYGEDWSKYYLHYIKYGKAEGRVAVKKTEELNYDAVFDASYYLEKYGDLKAAYGTDETKALQHFINYGMKEGRQANAEFNVQIYQSRYADLRNAYGDDLEKYYIHYIKYGKKEGRSAV